MDKPKNTKQPRLRRKRKPSPIQLTDRDEVILRALHKYRFLTTEHLQILTETDSAWGMNKRLRLLYDHKFTDRPKAQHAIFSHADKRPVVHALGNEGAKLLSSRFGIAMPPSVYWTEKNRRIREKHIEHTLGISDFMVGMIKVCREAGNLRVIDKEEILAQSPKQTNQGKYPFRWKTIVHIQGQAHDIAIVPDYVFGLEYLDEAEGRNKSFFFLEVDRGGMSIVRTTTINQTSFLRKMQSYEDTWNRKLVEKRFGIKSFRVLTLTSSDQRIGTMIETYRKELKDRVPAGVFLFRPKHLEFDQKMVWKNAAGNMVELFP